MSKYHATIADHNGTPTLFVNGRAMFLNAPYLAKAPYETFAPARMGIYFLHDHAFAVRPDGTPDIGPVRKSIEDVLAKEPDALIMLRSFPPASHWWLDQHPDEELRFDIDIRKYTDEHEYLGYAKTRDASWASEVWLKTAAGWYEEWCRQLHRAFDGQIIGHQFGMGSHGENNPIGAPTFEGRWFCSDFSQRMVEYFRGWLKKKYETPDALRDAWGDTRVTFDTAAVPDRVERLRTDWFTFRSPKKAQVADYYLAFAERVETCVITFCEAIKRATDDHCIAGSHLGAFLDNGFHGYIYHQAPINLFRRALAHPAVNTLTSPASYENKGIGGDANSMMPLATLALHNKLAFQDQDSFTHNVPADFRKSYTFNRLPANARESCDVLKRDFAHALIRGYGLWWHPLIKGVYDDPEVVRCIGKLTEIGRQSLRFPRGAADGFAMIVDEESVYHQQCANQLFYPMLYHQRQFHWNRSGVPWDVFIHNDLGNPKMPDRKVYYFLNTFYLSDDEIVAIERKVKRSGAVVIWTYAPGIQSPGGFSLERVERLTGFRLKSIDVQALPRITFTNFDHPYAEFRPAGYVHPFTMWDRQPIYIGAGPLGNDARDGVFGPIIYVDDKDATTLGELDSIQEPGFCVKEMDGWTSVFCSAPMINAQVMRNVARASGLHVYSDGDDVVLAGKSFVMIHAKTAGEKTILLPRATDVYECYDDREVGRGITEIRETLPEFGTRIYFLGSRDAFVG